jgi:hypothetical protein
LLGCVTRPVGCFPAAALLDLLEVLPSGPRRSYGAILRALGHYREAALSVDVLGAILLLLFSWYCKGQKWQPWVPEPAREARSLTRVRGTHGIPGERESIAQYDIHVAQAAIGRSGSLRSQVVRVHSPNQSGRFTGPDARNTGGNTEREGGVPEARA